MLLLFQMSAGYSVVLLSHRRCIQGVGIALKVTRIWRGVAPIRVVDHGIIEKVTATPFIGRNCDLRVSECLAGLATLSAPCRPDIGGITDYATTTGVIGIGA